MSKLLLICGYAGSGKSTAAHFLRDWSWETTSLSFPIKSMLSVLGLSTLQLWGDKKGEPTPILCGRTPRHAMQTLGTEWRDMISPLLWCEAWWRSHGNARINLVIDDVRFLHEVEFFRERKPGCRVMKVIRPGTGLGKHQSEREIEYIEENLLLTNSLDEDHMRRQLIQMIEENLL